MKPLKIIAEEQKGGRYKFVAIYPLGVRCLASGNNTTRSLRTWASKRSAVAAGRREYRI